MPLAISSLNHFQVYKLLLLLNHSLLFVPEYQVASYTYWLNWCFPMEWQYSKWDYSWFWNSKHYCWYDANLWGMISDSSPFKNARSWGWVECPHSLQKYSGNVKPNTGLLGVLVGLVSLQRTIYEWWRMAISDVAIVGDYRLVCQVRAWLFLYSHDC